jgi:uncharacterized protein
MPLDWNTHALSAGLACYRNQEFFEAHEHWEAAWNQLAGMEKSFVQGLIQVTVAMHHYRNSNRVGAESLLQRALARFEPCPDHFCSVNVSSLATDVRAWINALEDRTASMPPAPTINLES